MKKPSATAVLAIFMVFLLLLLATAVWLLISIKEKNTYLSHQLSALQLDTILSREQARLEQQPSYLPTYDQKEIGMITNSVIRDYEKVDNGDGSITWWLLRADTRNDFDRSWYLEKITEDQRATVTTHSAITQRNQPQFFLEDDYTTIGIVSILSKSGKALLVASGGDGCGGKAAYWTTDGKAYTKILQVGSGCVVGTYEPLSGGIYLGEYIYAGEVVPTEINVNATRTTRLWKYDPETSTRTVIAVSSDLPPGVLYPVKSKHPDFDLIFKYDTSGIPGEPELQEFYGYDLETKRYEKLDRNQAIEQ